MPVMQRGWEVRLPVGGGEVDCYCKINLSPTTDEVYKKKIYILKKFTPLHFGKIKHHETWWRKNPVIFIIEKMYSNKVLESLLTFFSYILSVSSLEMMGSLF